MKDNTIIKDKSKDFVLKIVEACSFLNEHNPDFLLSEELLRSGAAVDRRIREIDFAELSSEDCIDVCHEMLPEARKAEYWLMLLKECDYIDETRYESLHRDCNEIMDLLKNLLEISKTNLKSENKK
jgi:four helix bundle protein